MNVYSCTDFDGVWPIRTAAIIVAPTELQARNLLLKTLNSTPDLDQDDDYEPVLDRVDLTKKQCIILNNGDY